MDETTRTIIDAHNKLVNERIGQYAPDEVPCLMKYNQRMAELTELARLAEGVFRTAWVVYVRPPTPELRIPTPWHTSVFHDIVKRDRYIMRMRLNAYDTQVVEFQVPQKFYIIDVPG